MDFKVMFSSFGLILLAELGDKTQIMALTLAAKTGKPVPVFAGSFLALGLLTLAAVLLGGLASEYIPQGLISRVAGVAFVVVGVLVFFKVL
ncbi:MAG: TMEM165/GDT1 family protein [Candidatus Coatesbacteria bacterium]|nr:MAG: TMEM165/GDT1 family protein [Candidatus Coatesbacteria bacterium]